MLRWFECGNPNLSERARSPPHGIYRLNSWREPLIPTFSERALLVSTPQAGRRSAARQAGAARPAALPLVQIRSFILTYFVRDGARFVRNPPFREPVKT